MIYNIIRIEYIDENGISHVVQCFNEAHAMSFEESLDAEGLWHRRKEKEQTK